MITTETRGAVATVTLNRPEKRNALNPSMIAALKAALAEAAADPEVHVVVLRGAGKDFCAGADLEALARIADAGMAENLEDARDLADLFRAMRRMPKPVVAAVHGRALGGGCGLATACDIVLACESARFGYPEVNLGFVAAIVMALLRRAVPEKAAFELLATGATVTAQRMAAIGVVQRVYPDDNFDYAGYAATLGAKPPGAMALTKQLLYSAGDMTFEAAIEAGVQANALARMTAECRRGISEFLKKSQPG